MPDLTEGVVFAGHRIDGVAGRGGMGTVYRATHLALDHMVALKVIAPDLAGDESFRERFKSESRIAVSLRHPNVVPIHHAGEEEGLLFVTMDLIDGPDLRRLLIERGALEPGQAVAILEQVASALDIAHSRGLVHRDIKPGNVLIDERAAGDHAYLTDFGLTKRLDQASEVSALTSTGAFVGTLDYVAPEQIRGEELDARTDVYALGCVLYEMLTARAPFADREEKVAKMYGHLQDPPAPLEGRAAGFDEVVGRAMAKDREGRYPSAGDLARAAAAALEGEAPAEAERSVATGPAAPTAAYGTPPEPTVEAAPPEPTVEAVPPEPTVETVPPEPTVETVPPEPTVETPPPDAGAPRAARAGTRSRAPLIAAMLAVAAAIGAGVLLLGGGDDDGEPTTATTDAGGGGGSEPMAAVLRGGVPGGRLPVGAAVAGGAVYSADRAGSAVLRGDAKSFDAEGDVTTSEPPEDLIVEDGSLWVTLPKAGQVLRMSPDLGEEATIFAGAEPSGIAAGQGSVWATNQGSGDLTRIDPAGNAAEQLPLDAQRPHGIAVTGDDVWVTDREAGELLRVDPVAGTPEERIPVGDNPKGVAVAGGVVWVANTDSGTVSLIDEDDGSEVDLIDVGGEPRAVDAFGGRVWVSNGDAEDKELDAKDGWVSVFDVADRSLIEPKLQVGGSPEGLAVGAGRVWVATGPEGLVRAIDPG